MKASEVLQESLDYLKGDGHWTQGEYARDKNGDRVETYCGDAVSFCSLGIISKCTKSSQVGLWVKCVSFLKEAIATRYGVESVIYFNDDMNLSKDEILRTFKMAVSLAKAQERAEATPETVDG